MANNSDETPTMPAPTAKDDDDFVVPKDLIFVYAEREIEYRVQMYNKLTYSCFSKCFEQRYKKATELNKDDNQCVDSCVWKYWNVVNLVGQLIAKDDRTPPK